MDNELTELARQAVASGHWRRMPGMLFWRTTPRNDKVSVSLTSGLTENCELADPGETTPGSDFIATGHAVVDGWHKLSDLVPDLTDPTTIGCLLALVREDWGMPTGITVHHRDDTSRWVVSWSGATHGGICGEGASEGEALLRALLAGRAG